jgi:hypothetical protein
MVVIGTKTATIYRFFDRFYCNSSEREIPYHPDQDSKVWRCQVTYPKSFSWSDEKLEHNLLLSMPLLADLLEKGIGLMESELY